MPQGLEESRYPYSSVLDFLYGGYWLMPDAMHIVLAYLAMLPLMIRVLLDLKTSTAFKTSVLYFSLVAYNNPAFEYANIKINEYFGLITLFIVIINYAIKDIKNYSNGPVVSTLIVFLFISLAHLFLLSFTYPELTQTYNLLLTKIAVNLKVLILVGNLWVVGININCTYKLNFLIRWIVIFGATAACIYFSQYIIYKNGIIPFGTYWDAGFTGLPSFGGTSIERGHFGKFMMPLAPFFLYALIAYKWRLCFSMYCLVMTINFSASSLFFFILFFIITAAIFYKKIFSNKGISILLIGLFFLLLLLVNFHDVYSAIFYKIYYYGIVGDMDGVGGRTLDILFQYLSVYPIGIGFSGSILRTPDGLPEINSGLYAFIAQFSVIALIFFIGFGNLIFRILHCCNDIGGNYFFVRCFKIGLILSPIIFIVDILWFIPTIWLGYQLLWVCCRNQCQNLIHSFPHKNDA